VKKNAKMSKKPDAKTKATAKSAKGAQNAKSTKSTKSTKRATNGNGAQKTTWSARAPAKLATLSRDPDVPTMKNRTGALASPMDASDVQKEAMTHEVSPPADMELDGVRAEYEAEGVLMGHMPIPTTVRGAKNAFVQAFKGKNAAVLLDKIGERLAFERTGTRLYEALIGKLDACGSWDGGPSRAELLHIMEEELEHFHVLREAMEELGGDPTAMTPAANVTDVVSSGIPQIVSDGRSTLAQSLCAIHVAELADNDGWDMLVSLCTYLELDDLAQRFQRCAHEEGEHLHNVRRWLNAHAIAAARGKGVETMAEANP
jgi:rubrerythrin